MLLMFVQSHCNHCDAMRLLLARLSFEYGIACSEKNVTEDEDNKKLFQSYREPDCDGFPLLVNTQTGKSSCGEITYKELVRFAGIRA